MTVHGNGRTGGVTGKGFRPGQSGNPGGRPKGLVRTVAEVVGDGRELLEVLQKIALDDNARPSDRITASRELLDRRYGKAPSFELVVSADADRGGGPESDLDAAIRKVLDDLAGPIERTRL